MVDTLVLIELSIGVGGAVFVAGRYIERFARSAGETRANRDDIDELDGRIDEVRERVDSIGETVDRIESKTDDIQQNRDDE